ncbi:cell division protein FtsZ [Chromatiales bacterium (ex Bugula neritina AB1)]|nr:cell division protein FtsZ [Chromatiales bacterium (ex Bugula neritina AB1)]
MIQPDLNQYQSAVIKLIGIGGGGCNAVEQMINADICGVDFMCVNTDAQALARFGPDNVIQLGTDITRGLGAGTNPHVGRLAAEEDREAIANAIDRADMLFLTAGMGGGTGTGAIPVIAQIARDRGILTVAVVTKPFNFEGNKRMQVAEEGISELRKYVDSLIVVPNENLLTHLGANTTLLEAFAASNDVLTNAVQSIAELVTNPGLINVDFADVRAVMSEMGEAMMSSGRGVGEFRARDAAIAASESPLIDGVNLRGARGVLANITGGSNLSMGDFQVVGDILNQITAADANVVIGTSIDQSMTDEIRVTVVATGLERALPDPMAFSDAEVVPTSPLAHEALDSNSGSRTAAQFNNNQRYPSFNTASAASAASARTTLHAIQQRSAANDGAGPAVNSQGTNRSTAKLASALSLPRSNKANNSTAANSKTGLSVRNTRIAAGFAAILLSAFFVTKLVKEPAPDNSVVTSDDVMELPADFTQLSKIHD